MFWRGRAQLPDLHALATRFLGAARAQAMFDRVAQQRGLSSAEQFSPDPRMVQFVETQLAGVIGSASARVMVARTVDEEPLDLGDVMRILEEASQLRAYSQALEDKSLSLQRATEELREANPQLTSLDRLKDDFIATVTHELRTPLTPIRALSELMADAPDMAPAQRQKFLGIVVTETERLSRLVNQVLDMAKLDSGNADWRSDEVDLGALLERAVQTTAELFRERGAVVELQLPESVPPLRADEDRLMQVVLNLLGNAAKFMPATGGRVQVRLLADDRGLTVQVQDNGPGVPPAQQHRVFERFQQRGDAAHRPHGTGLGLPIIRRIIEHFGGRIWLQSDPGQGACFVLQLPWPESALAGQDGRARWRAGQPSTRLRLRSGSQNRTPTMSTRIVVADDEANILISLEFLLQRAGYEVSLARDGLEALTLVRQVRPQQLLLDVMMPGETGFEVCQELRADESMAGMQVLMLTAKGRDTDVAKGLALGANAYMTKPFSTKDLLQKVQDLLQRPP